MIAYFVVSKLNKSFKSSDRAYSVLHEDKGGSNVPHSSMPLHELDDPPMQLDEEYRLC